MAEILGSTAEAELELLELEVEVEVEVDVKAEGDGLPATSIHAPMQNPQQQKKKKEKIIKKSRDLSVEKMACSPPTTFKQQQHYYTGHHLRNNLATWASAQALVLSGQMQAHQPHPTGFFTHALIVSVATHTHIFFSHFSPI